MTLILLEKHEQMKCTTLPEPKEASRLYTSILDKARGATIRENQGVQATNTDKMDNETAL